MATRETVRDCRPDLGRGRCGCDCAEASKSSAGRLIGVGHHVSLFRRSCRAGDVGGRHYDDAREAALARRRGPPRRAGRPGLRHPRPAAVGTRRLNGALGRMATLQIDSVNVFARSHYLPLFSRLGVYDTATLDRLLFARRPAYVESWAHVAAFIPAADWGLFQFRARTTAGEVRLERVDADASATSWSGCSPSSPPGGRCVPRRSTTMRSRRAAAWWDWDVVKEALEHLCLFGDVAIAGRRGFERRYALAEQVIPAETLARPVPRDDAVRELVRRPRAPTAWRRHPISPTTGASATAGPS